MTTSSGQVANPDDSRPILAILAGPNGSGKSTFYRNFLRHAYPYVINADEIAKSLSGIDPERSLEAARIAEQSRIGWIEQRKSFCLETVFSRTEYWLQVIFDAIAASYRVEVYFLCVASSILNTARVETRVQHGGHSVPADRIAKRYPRSIQTAVMARGIVDEFWLYDNSVAGVSPRLLGRFLCGRPFDVAAEIPAWAVPFFASVAKPN